MEKVMTKEEFFIHRLTDFRNVLEDDIDELYQHLIEHDYLRMYCKDQEIYVVNKEFAVCDVKFEKHELVNVYV